MGTDQTKLQRLVFYWANGFDWNAQQCCINRLPWHTANISGTAVNYLRFEGENPAALPIILANGWPSTAIELVELAPRRATPTLYGGLATDALTVIVPALPRVPLLPAASHAC
ncbi:MAG: hypothetical protein HIU81_09900 [Acidobacteria bacterium]|nr:hypothetical protein [Acidobacteriota bacterium]